MSGLRQRIWTLDIEALDAVDNPVTLRFASGDYTRRDPGPVDHYYEPRLKQPALFQVAASTGPLLNSNNRSGYGEAELINTDGGLDHLADYAVDGRLLTLRLVDDDTAVDVLVATVASLAFGERSVTVRLRDPQSLLQLPLGLSRYAGDNVLPDGVEGTQDDIAGTTKPRIYGSVENCTPVLVNTSKLIYQVHDSADVTVTAVRDRGVPLTPAGEALDLADLLASSPAAGEWRWFEGYIALGATPAGTLTCDATRASAGAGQVFSELAAPHVVPAGDVSALDAVGAVGLYVRGDSTPAELLDRLAAGVGAYWAFNAAGEIRVVLLQAPDVAPDLTVEDHQILKLTRRATGSGANGLPIAAVTIAADRIETVQTDVAAGAVTPGRWTAQTRDVRVANSAVATRHPLAAELQINSPLRSLAAASAVATTLAGLLGVRRDQVAVDVALATQTSLVIGQSIELNTPRLGYPRTFRLLGYTLDARRRLATLDLWG